MNIQLTDRIKQNARSFSKGQRLIARYIEEHYDKVAFMTASKLGAVVGVSESTVVRFATEIGYSGYPALQQAMQEMIRNRLTSVQRLEITSTNTPLERLLDASLEQDIDIIRRTKETVSHEAFYSAADALVQAKRVYIIGAGSSLALATFLAHYMSLVFDAVQLINATSEAQILQQIVHIGPGDALIGISFPRLFQEGGQGAALRLRPRRVRHRDHGQHAFAAGLLRAAGAAGQERYGFVRRLARRPARADQRADRHRGDQEKGRGGQNALRPRKYLGRVRRLRKGGKQER